MQANPYPNQLNAGFQSAGGQTAANIKHKKSMHPLLIVGIVVLAVLLATVCLVFSTSFIKSITTNLGYKNELVFHDLRVKHPANWSETSRNADTVELTKSSGKGRMLFAFFHSDFYYDSNTAVNEFVSEYEKIWDNLHLAGDVQSVTINDTDWKKIVFYGTLNGENRKCMQLVHAADYDVYSIVYMSTEEDFNKYLAEANRIADSAYLPPKETNADTVKQKIVGEWDCGNTGYLLINSDNTYYFYKDSSKDTDNMVSGAYEAADGISTNAAGYAQGITFTTTIKTFTVDGTAQEVSQDAKIAYAFTPDGTGRYNGKNLNTGSSFKMTKIR